MKEEIENSEFEAWAKNRVTMFLRKTLKEDIKAFKESILNIGLDNAIDNRMYWYLRGNLNAVDNTINFLESYDILKDILSSSKKEVENGDK